MSELQKILKQMQLTFSDISDFLRIYECPSTQTMRLQIQNQASGDKSIKSISFFRFLLQLHS